MNQRNFDAFPKLLIIYNQLLEEKLNPLSERVTLEAIQESLQQYLGTKPKGNKLELSKIVAEEISYFLLASKKS